jgi:Mg2+/citrate symporter
MKRQTTIITTTAMLLFAVYSFNPMAAYALLAAIVDKIQTIDERETLKYTLGLEIVTDLLKMHAAELVINQTAGTHSIKP